MIEVSLSELLSGKSVAKTQPPLPAVASETPVNSPGSTRTVSLAELLAPTEKGAVEPQGAVVPQPESPTDWNRYDAEMNAALAPQPNDPALPLGTRTLGAVVRGASNVLDDQIAGAANLAKQIYSSVFPGMAEDYRMKQAIGWNLGGERFSPLGIADTTIESREASKAATIRALPSTGSLPEQVGETAGGILPLVAETAVVGPGALVGGTVAAGQGQGLEVGKQLFPNDERKQTELANAMTSISTISLAAMGPFMSKMSQPVGKYTAAMLVGDIAKNVGLFGATDASMSILNSVKIESMLNPEEDIKDVAWRVLKDKDTYKNLVPGMIVGGLMGGAQGLFRRRMTVADWLEKNQARLAQKDKLSRGDVRDAPTELLPWKHGKADRENLHAELKGKTVDQIIQVLDQDGSLWGPKASASDRLGMIESEPARQAVVEPPTAPVEAETRLQDPSLLPTVKKQAQEAVAVVPEQLGAAPGQGGTQAPPRPPPPGVSPPQEGVSYGTTKAAIADIREKIGLPPIVKGDTVDLDTANARNRAFVEADPELPARVLADLDAKPRPPDPDEVIILGHENVRLQNERTALNRRMVQEYESPDGVQPITEELIAKNMEAIDRLQRIRSGAGSSWGISGRIQQLFHNPDFTIDWVRDELRSTQKGQPLTPKQEKEAADIADKFQKYKQADEANAATVEEAQSRSQAEGVHKDLVEEVGKSEKPRQKAKRKTQTLVEWIDPLADAAEKRLSEAFTRLSANPIDPKMVADVATVIARKIARGIDDVARISAEMVEKYGEAVRPYLDEGYAKAKAMVDGRIKKLAFGKKGREKIKEELKAPQTQEEAQAKAEASLGKRVEANERAEITYDVRKIARSLIEGGVRELNPLLDALHPILRRFIPDISRRETMDAFSGYGKYKPPSKDAIDMEMAKSTREAQLSARLADLIEKKVALKTGQGRQPDSAQARKLTKQVNREEKKIRREMERLGIKVEPLENQIRSSLQSAETRLRNWLEDTWQEILSGEQITKGKPAPDTPEIARLRSIASEVREIYDAVFPKEPTPRRELTPEQRVQMALKALEKASEHYEAMARSGDVAPKPKAPSKTPQTPEIEASRARRDSFKNTIELMRLIQKKEPDPVEVANRIFQNQRLARIADMKKRMAEGRFDPKPPKEFPKDAKSLEIDKMYQDVQRAFAEARWKAKQSQRSPGRKVWEFAENTFQLSRSLMTSFDLSAIGRQGLFIGLGHPLLAARAMKPMLKALLTEKGLEDVQRSIASRENFPIYQRAKLFLADVNANVLTQMEEEFRTRWIRTLANLPKKYVVGLPWKGVLASNRAYTAYLNLLRADAFDTLSRTLTRGGAQPTQIEAHAIANYINVATGRGTFFGRTGGTLLNDVFFAPRFVASRFNMILGQPFYHGTARTRALIAKEYAKFGIGMATAYSLATAAGLDVEWNPKSSLFGKIPTGDSFIDPLAGIGNVSSAFTRAITSSKKTYKGETVSTRRDPDQKRKITDLNWYEEVARYVRTKFGPAAAGVVDYFSGEDVMGQPVTPSGIVRKMATPLPARDIYRALTEENVPEGAALTIMALLGFSITEPLTTTPSKGKSKSSAYGSR